MLVRRKVMLAGLTGALVPFFGLRAQPSPGPDVPPRDMGRDEHHDDHNERPHMPPPRHEERPRPPEGRGWHWRSGHWTWNGRQWVWIHGRWYR